MVKRSKVRMKDTKSQKAKKKKRQHFGFAKQRSDFAHVAIERAWDHRKTVRQNYEAIGLCVNPGKDLGQEAAKLSKKAKKTQIYKELQAVKEMPKATAYVAKSMDIKEQRLLTKLVEKHGEDYHKMARDIKINVHQKTEAQLEKRIKLMQQLQAM